MQDGGGQLQVEIRSHFRRFLQPLLQNPYHHGRIEDAANSDPGYVKANANQLDTNRNEAQVNNPGRKALFVEDSSSDEEPRIDFNRLN